MTDSPYYANVEVITTSGRAIQFEESAALLDEDDDAIEIEIIQRILSEGIEDPHYGGRYSPEQIIRVQVTLVENEHAV